MSSNVACIQRLLVRNSLLTGRNERGGGETERKKNVVASSCNQPCCCLIFQTNSWAIEVWEFNQRLSFPGSISLNENLIFFSIGLYSIRLMKFQWEPGTPRSFVNKTNGKSVGKTACEGDRREGEILLLYLPVWPENHIDLYLKPPIGFFLLIINDWLAGFCLPPYTCPFCHSCQLPLPLLLHSCLKAWNLACSCVWMEAFRVFFY